jgi:hypothetical protein
MLPSLRCTGPHVSADVPNRSIESSNRSSALLALQPRRKINLWLAPNEGCTGFPAKGPNGPSRWKIPPPAGCAIYRSGCGAIN